MAKYDLDEVLRRVDDEEVILKIPIRLDYARIGGYNTWMFNTDINYVEELTGKQLKSLWRWWIRALLSVIYGGGKSYSFLENIIVDELHLGSDKKPSLLSIIVQPIHKKRKRINYLNEYNKIFGNDNETRTRWAILKKSKIEQDDWEKGLGDVYKYA